MIPDSFFQAEVRDGFAVTEKRKRIWAAELTLLRLFDNFCRLHDLQYFAAYGTLLGAVRHRGFVPWDDDVDLAMLRPDYERMKQLAPGYFLPPFTFQTSSVSEGMQLVTPFAKLRDDRTAAVEFPSAPASYSQGIFIDIFPLDSVEDAVPGNEMRWRMKLELYTAMSDPLAFRDMAAAGKMLFDADTAEQLAALPDAERMMILEDYCLQNFDPSARIDFLRLHLENKASGYPGGYFREAVLLPFEFMQIPVPVSYEAVLRCIYGNYMQNIKGASRHEGAIMDPDRSYREYLS